MAFRPFLSSSGISPVVRGRWAGPLLLVYILWYNIYSLLCSDGRSRAAPPLSSCCGHCRCRRCPRRHLYCGGCRANPNIPPFLFFFHLLRPTKSSPLRLLLWCLTGGERKVGQSPSPSIYNGILSVVCCVRMEARRPRRRSFAVVAIVGAPGVLVRHLLHYGGCKVPCSLFFFFLHLTKSPPLHLFS